MKFSLKRYLTEKLQSSTIKDLILNDPGGFCKFYKHQYQSTYSNNSNHPWDKAQILCNKLQNMFKSLYNLSKYDYSNYQLKQQVYINGKNIIITDEKVKKIHALYMKTYNEYINVCKLLFTKPSTETLIAILNRAGMKDEYTNSVNMTNIDLANITDDMFTKYSYVQIKADPKLYDNIINCYDMDAVLYFLKDNTLAAVQKGANVKKVQPDYYISHFVKSYGNLSVQDMKLLQSGDISLYTQAEFTDTLQDGTKLTWPLVSAERKTCIIDKIKHSGINLQYTNDNYDFTPGKFLSKASRLQKNTNWGKSDDDYVIIFKSSDYLVHKNDAYNKNKEAHINDVKKYVSSKFRWLYNIFGDIIPYGSYTKKEKQEKVYKFMQKVELYTLKYSIEADTYCTNMLESNHKKYEALKQVIKSINLLSSNNGVKQQYASLSQTLNQYIELSKKYKNKIKQNTSINSNLSEQVSLFAAYSYILNDFIKTVSDISITISSLEQKSNDILSQIKNMDIVNKYHIESSTYDIRNGIDKLLKLIDDDKQKYITALSQAQQKLDESFN